MTTTLTETDLRVAGRTIHLTELGSGPPVVLLHGGGPGASGVSNYRRNLDAFAQEHRVLVPDLPGYGRSSKGVDGRDPFGFLAAQIRGMLDELQIAQADLVGNSYGGSCALRLALDTPQRVRRMVLMGPGGIGTTRAMPTDGLKALLSYYEDEGPTREKLERFVREYLVLDGDRVPQEAIEERYASSIDPEVIASPPLRRPSGPGAPRTLWRMDFTRDKRLAELATPTLVIWGAHDNVNRPSGGQALAETMPHCDLLLAADCAHWVQWERAQFFNDAALAFLAEARDDEDAVR